MPVTGIINKPAQTASLANGATHTQTYTLSATGRGWSLRDARVSVNAAGACSYHIKINETVIHRGGVSAESQTDVRNLHNTYGPNTVIAVEVTNDSGGALEVNTDISGLQC
tara:strand:- start:7846 stop:8178 length:333 start_codon:yes stop_codon:yes gene_type:complete